MNGLCKSTQLNTHMIDYTERCALECAERPKGWIGYDSEGKTIKVGDRVEVVRAEDLRRGNRDYAFCDVGAKGTVLRTGACWPIGWNVEVEFQRGASSYTVGCVDFYLKKIS